MHQELVGLEGKPKRFTAARKEVKWNLMSQIRMFEGKRFDISSKRHIHRSLTFCVLFIATLLSLSPDFVPAANGESGYVIVGTGASAARAVYS